MLHHIQKSIMDKLATSETKRYGELKPAELDGNVFGYHLKALLIEKYITKSEQGDYTLTQKGKDYIVHRYENPLLQAHSIFLIALSRGDEWLVRERLVQPLVGMIGFIHGEPAAGEPIQKTAERRLAEKTGLNTPLRVHSNGFISITRDGILESYSNAVILVGETDQEITIAGDATGRNFWLQTADMSSKSVLPSCNDIIMRIKNSDTSPFELSYNL
jgi:ADP-ribose pyrophosphatase YjhB (NUDIX family)